MYHPTTRVLTVLELLQTYGSMSGPDLARRLEVSPRSVRNYVAMLQDLGIPVEATRGRYGTYTLRPGYKLPPLMFTDDEAVALVAGLLVARRAGLSIAAPALAGALAKLERVLPDGPRARVEALRAVDIHLDAPPTSSEAAVVATLSVAAQAGRRVRLRYRSFAAEETAREFDPYGVVCRQGRWYAAGHDHLRGALRTFRLDRVLEVELGADSFDRPRDFAVSAHVERAIATAPIGWKVEVLLETTLDDARRQLPPMSAILEAVPGGVLLRHQAYHPDGLGPIARLLLGFDCPLVVVTPPALRAQLRALAARANDLANREGAERSGHTPDRAGTSAQTRHASEQDAERGEALPPA